MLLARRLFCKKWSLCLRVDLADFCIRGAEVVDATYVDLPGRVLGKVVHDIISDVLDGPVTAQRDSTHRIDTNVVEQSNTDCMTYVLKDLLCKWWAVCVRIDFGVRVLHRCIFFDASLGLDELWSQSVDALAVVVIAFKCVAMSDACRSLESNSTASISAHSILILDGHYFLREITFIHVKIETIHCNQLGKRYVICLHAVIWQSISEHEYTLLRGMSMKVDVDFQVLELLRILCNRYLGCPDRRMVPPRWLTVESV